MAFTSDLASSLAPDVLERFLRYVRIDTQADRDAEEGAFPSSPGQRNLSELLLKELTALGLTDAELDDNCYVYATLPGSNGGPVVGLIAHVDTAPDAPGKDVEPIVHSGYDGGVITLPRNGTVLDPAKLIDLGDKVGEDIVTTSGDTLLGADDKAGCAEIMGAIAYLATNPDVPRPTLRVCFTPDEEIGMGPSRFDLDKFGADCAYTIDGGQLGELQDESFTAKQVIVTIKGQEVHPGTAKGIMVNAGRLAAKIVASLPDELTPENTDGRQGFIHVFELSGSAGEARIAAILRDYDDDVLDGHVQVLRDAVDAVLASEPRATCVIEETVQYPNMRTYLEAFPDVVTRAEQALRAEGIEPVRNPIRGGTDGSQLSAMGLPTPNLFAGGHEMHSLREWVSVQDMAAASATIVRLAEAWAS